MAKHGGKSRKSGPVQSMTGFGSGAARAAGYRAEVELRAVNGRFLSLKTRLHGEYACLEEDLRACLAGRLGRGNVELRAELRPEGGGADIRIDADRVKAYLTAWRKLGRQLEVPGEVEMEDLVSLPDLFLARPERTARRRALPALLAAVEKAVARFEAMRRREGAALAGVLKKHLTGVDRLRAQMVRRAPRAVRELVGRAATRLDKLLGAVPAAARSLQEGDLAREVAHWAERTDIAEEMHRLESHVAQFRAALATGGELGKRLDFLVQEMHREANTAGSKAADTVLSGHVVEMKLYIEKLREQVQNVL